jgi:hypothetical protein
MRIRLTEFFRAASHRLLELRAVKQQLLGTLVARRRFPRGRPARAQSVCEEPGQDEQEKRTR